jgi:hypothetical protein
MYPSCLGSVSIAEVRIFVSIVLFSLSTPLQGNVRLVWSANAAANG